MESEPNSPPTVGKLPEYYRKLETADWREDLRCFVGEDGEPIADRGIALVADNEIYLVHGPQNLYRKFARTFAKVWASLPEAARDTLIKHWTETPGGHTGSALQTPIIGICQWPPGGAYGELTGASEIWFWDRAVESMPAEVLGCLIAHEIAETIGNIERGTTQTMVFLPDEGAAWDFMRTKMGLNDDTLADLKDYCEDTDDPRQVWDALAEQKAIERMEEWGYDDGRISDWFISLPKDEVLSLSKDLGLLTDHGESKR